MPGIPPVLTQAQVVDYSFMEIKNLKELVDSDSPEETGKAQEIVKLRGMTSLRISSNEIDDLENFHKYIDMVIENATDLQWLDLSYNKIPR